MSPRGLDYLLLFIDTPMPILLPSHYEGLAHLHELNDEDLGDDRAISLPSHTVTVQDMIETLKTSNGAASSVRLQLNRTITKIINTWPLI